MEECGIATSKIRIDALFREGTSLLGAHTRLKAGLSEFERCFKSFEMWLGEQKVFLGSRADFSPSAPKSHFSVAKL